jgi:hypothetical protein
LVLFNERMGAMESTMRAMQLRVDAVAQPSQPVAWGRGPARCCLPRHLGFFCVVLDDRALLPAKSIGFVFVLFWMTNTSRITRYAPGRQAVRPVGHNFLRHSPRGCRIIRPGRPVMRATRVMRPATLITEQRLVSFGYLRILYLYTFASSHPVPPPPYPPSTITKQGRVQPTHYEPFCS